MNVNTFGGTDLHQELLDQYILAMARGMHSTAEGLQSPRFAELLTAISTIVVPYNDPRIDILAEGREGVSDGKVWLVRQDVLVEKAYQAVLDSEALAWFEESLSEVIAIAQGGQGQHIQAIQSQDLVDALAPWLDQDRPEWRELMGYDEARLQKKPVLHALQIWQAQGVMGFAQNERVLFTGDYNQHAQDIVACLQSTNAPRLENHSESCKVFANVFSAISKKHDVHSEALYSVAYLGIAHQCFGVLSMSDEESFKVMFEAVPKLATETEKHGNPYCQKQKKALTKVLSDPKTLGCGANSYLNSPLVPPFDENASIRKTTGPKPFR